jgi:UDP-N-acetylglucosamine transferase subunit ALG13
VKVFVTVGAQLPFDRLIAEVRRLESINLIQVNGQVGETSLNLPSNYKRYLGADEYSMAIHECDVIISHAGMGSIITALDYAKPIIIVPRRKEYNEHRNNHQLDTIAHVGRKASASNGLFVCDSECDIEHIIKRENFVLDKLCLKPPVGILKYIESIVGL